MTKLQGFKNQFFNQFSTTWTQAPIEAIDWFLGMFDLDAAKYLLKKINSDRVRYGKIPYYPNYGHRLF